MSWYACVAEIFGRPIEIFEPFNAYIASYNDAPIKGDNSIHWPYLPLLS